MPIPMVRERTEKWLEIPATYAGGEQKADSLRCRPGSDNLSISIEFPDVATREVDIADLRAVIDCVEKDQAPERERTVGL